MSSPSPSEKYHQPESEVFEVVTSKENNDSLDHKSITLEEDPQVLADNLKLNRKVVCKIDCIILPFLVVTMFLQLLDKNCLQYAALYGLREDTNLVGQQYSWLATIFYIAYLVAEIPMFLVLSKVQNLPRFMSILLSVWGGLLMCMSACTNFTGLMVVRFFMGFAEAAIQPACIIISSNWYTKKEQPLRLALWSNTFAGIFNGIFGYGFSSWNGKLHTWQYIFIVYGSVTVVWGIVCFFMVPKDYESAWFLNENEKKCAMARTATNQTGIHFGVNDIKWSQITESLCDPKYWCLVVFIIVQNFINAGITNFNTFIIQGFGYSKYRTMLLATPQAAVAMGACVSCAIIISFFKNIRYMLIVITTSVTMTGIIMIYKLDPHLHQHACLAAVYICGFYNAPYVLTLSMITSNTSGQTKKAFNSVSVGLFYALGNLIGPQFFLEDEAPTYSTGIKSMLAACVIMLFMASGYAGLCFIENRRRHMELGLNDNDTLLTEIEIGEQVDKFDLTDHQNRHFKYTY